MQLRRLSRTFLEWLGRPLRAEHSSGAARRGARIHVIILDGTMSTLEPGYETHAGRTYRLCCEMAPQVSVYYEAGVQWPNWRATPAVLMGKGINRQIRRAYGYLASRYRPGDRIYLMGYSRGAYAVRSLAGVIDKVGLLRVEAANIRNIRTAYRHYQYNPASASAERFRALHCHDAAPIEMIGVWDTVKALGLRLPILWMLAEAQHGFHDHRLGPGIRRGFHALALEETRQVFAPVMWQDDANRAERVVEQVWFPGSHGDVGGQLAGFEPARPLANLSLIWMLEKAEASGLPLPGNWRARIYTDPRAPSVGSWRGWAKIFLLRAPRRVGVNRSEQLHESLQHRPLPRGRIIRLWRGLWGRLI